MKPGIKTTECLITGAALLLPLIATACQVPWQAQAISYACAAIYVIGRTYLKTQNADLGGVAESLTTLRQASPLKDEVLHGKVDALLDAVTTLLNAPADDAANAKLDAAEQTALRGT